MKFPLSLCRRSLCLYRQSISLLSFASQTIRWHFHFKLASIHKWINSMLNAHCSLWSDENVWRSNLSPGYRFNTHARISIYLNFIEMFCFAVKIQMLFDGRVQDFFIGTFSFYRIRFQFPIHSKAIMCSAILKICGNFVGFFLVNGFGTSTLKLFRYFFIAHMHYNCQYSKISPIVFLTSTWAYYDEWQ